MSIRSVQRMSAQSRSSTGTRYTNASNVMRKQLSETRSAIIQTQQGEYDESKLSVFPPIGEFKNAEVGVPYTMLFSIQNRGAKLIDVKITPPITGEFQLLHVPKRGLAPGLETTFKVKYYGEKEQAFTDQLIISTKAQTIKVPLKATPPMAEIDYSKQIDFGTVLPELIQTQTMTITNIGLKSGKFAFLIPDDLQDSIGIEPREGVIEAESAIDVKVTLQTQSETGIQRGHINLRVFTESVVKTKPVDYPFNIVAQVVEARVSLIHPKNRAPIESIHFGSTYFGKTLKQPYTLFNASPFPVRFGFDTPVHEGEEDEPKEPSFYAEPSTGVIPAFGELPVSIMFAPEKPDEKSGFAATRAESHESEIKFKEELLLEVNETRQQIMLDMEGTGLSVDVSINMKNLHFGECATNDNRDILLIMANTQALPVPFSIPHQAHFRFIPSEGTLAPFETANIRVMFSPTQLGEFKRRVPIKLHNKLLKKVIYLHGSCNKIGKKTETIRGLEAIPEDFEVEPKFVANPNRNELSKHSEKKAAYTLRERREKERESLLATKSMSEALAYQKSKKNRKQFDDFLKTQRTQRLEKRQQRQKSEHISKYISDLLLGIVPTLEEPIPAVPKTRDPLYVASKFGGRSRRHPIKFDPNRLIERKFNEEPQTKEEKQDVTIRLNAKMLNKVRHGPKSIDFGDVSVFSKLVKNFSVCNDLSHHVLVQFADDMNDQGVQGESRMEVYPKAQVIPPGAIAGFDMRFFADSIQPFQQMVYFTVNESSKIKTTILADVHESDVRPSATNLSFRFDEHNLERSLKRTITLTNHGTAPAQFEFGSSGDKRDFEKHFDVSPRSGIIEPKKELEVTIQFTPGSLSKGTHTYLLSVKGQTKDIPIKLIADNPPAKVSIAEKKVDFGTIPVGLKKIKYLTLKNTTKHAAVFHVDLPQDVLNNDKYSLTVSPAKGKVMPNSTQKVMLEMLAHTTIALNDIPIDVDIRGGKTTRVTLFAKSLTPKVESLSGDDIKFGSIYVGASTMRVVKLKNTSAIPAVLYVDMVDKPDFKIADANGTLVTLETPPNAMITIASDVADDESEHSDHESLAAEEEDEDVGEDGIDEEEMKGERYQFVIPEESTIEFQMLFQPRVVTDYAFPMAFGLPGSTSLALKILANALKPRMMIRPPLVNFNSRVVWSEDKGIMPHRQLIYLTNEDQSELYWEFGKVEALSQPNIFRLEPTEGRLMQGQTTQVQVFFTPREKKKYDIKIPLYLDGTAPQPNENDSKNPDDLPEGDAVPPYTHLVVLGQGANPKLSFDVPNIVLPTVPLNTKATALFNVINEGYSSLKLRYKLPADTDRIPLALKFIDGTELNAERESLPVQVEFESDKPMSFTAKVDFYDDEQNRFSIMVTCTADASLLTTYPFTVSMKEGYELRCDEVQSSSSLKRYIQFVPRDSEDGDDMGSSSFTPSVYSSYSGTSSTLSKNTRLLRKIYSRRSLRRLMKFLNHTVLATPVDDLIKSIMLSNGSLVYDIIQTLSGKKAPGRLKQLPHVKRELAIAVRDQYAQLLTFLKSYGALLNEVTPDILLRYDEYRALPSLSNGGKRLSESQFRYQNTSLWCTIIYQIIRIFQMARITVKQFNSLFNHLDEPEKEASKVPLASSNIYSQAECILVRWLEYHYNAIYGSEEKKKSDFHIPLFSFGGKQMNDSIILSAVLQSHLVHLSKHFESLKLQPTENSHFEHNARLVIEALQLAQIDYPIQTADILQANPRDMLLFVMYLYNVLPQFLPKASVVFNSCLGEPVEKYIQLSNPTNNEIEYQIELQCGNEARKQEFKLLVPEGSQEDRLILAPKQHIKFGIRVTPRFSASFEARLVFLAKSRRAQTMVFSLKTDTNTNGNYLQEYTAESRLYEMEPIELEIPNPFKSAAMFRVALKQWNDSTERKTKKKKKKKKDTTFCPDPFWYTNDVISIKSSQKKRFVLNYLPFVLNRVYKAKLIFTDPKVGEFTVLVTANVTSAEVCGKFPPISIEMDPQVKGYPLSINVPVAYPVLERAYAQLRERTKKYRYCTNSTHASIPNSDEKREYTVVVDSNRYFKTPETFTFIEGKLQVPFEFSFSPNRPGRYPCHILLQHAHDTRSIEFDVIVRAEPTKMQLSFAVPTRNRVVQEIPIHNHSGDTTMIVRATLKGDFFEGPTELRVPAGKSLNYPLVFYPMKQQLEPVQGELVLNNVDNGEKYIYLLEGIVEDPIAEKRLDYACEARQLVEAEIEVPNWRYKGDSKKKVVEKKAVSYAVETDLPFVNLKDSTTFTVSSEHAIFKLEMLPTLGGEHEGTLVFRDLKSDECVWFVVHVNVERSPPEASLELDVAIRESTIAEIEIENPTDAEVVFDVHREGEALHGLDSLNVAANSSVTYELAYAPLTLKQQGEGRVTFFSEELGEFWYLLHTKAKKPDASSLPLMTAELGKTAIATVKLENPLPEETIRVSIHSTNPRNFKPVTSEVVISDQPGTFDIEYRPSSVGANETGKIIASHPSIGEFVYECVGQGTPPTAMDPVKVVAEVQRTVSSMLTFRNPFPSPRQFMVQLQQDSTRFKMLLKTPEHKPHRLRAFASLHIPFTFIPFEILDYHARVVITDMQTSLSWTYPIVGITEVSSPTIYNLNCVARNAIVKQFTFPLKGLSFDDIDDTTDDFVHDISINESEEKYHKAMRFSMQLHREPVKSSQASASSYPLNYRIDYGPLRPFDGQVELIFRRTNGGGQWRFSVHLSSQPPEIDDVIDIEAPSVGKTARVSFRLSNIFANSTAFEAYFTPDSPFDFAVSPEKGSISPHGYEGTQFIVSYTASNYGKAAHGTLIIDTDQMQWIYRVNGMLPKIRKPKATSKIETRLSANTEKALAAAKRKTKKNFLHRNIQSSRHGTKPSRGGDSSTSRGLLQSKRSSRL